MQDVYSGVLPETVLEFQETMIRLQNARVDAWEAARALATEMVRRDLPEARLVFVEVDDSDGTPTFHVIEVRDGEDVIVFTTDVPVMTIGEEELNERLDDAPWDIIFDQVRAEGLELTTMSIQLNSQ